MKEIIQRAMALVLVSGATAYAAQGQSNEGMGILTLIFLGFFAVIVVMQLLPGIVLFFSMIYGLVSSARKETLPATGGEQNRTD